MADVLEFKKRLKETAPPEMRYVTIAVFTDGSNGFIEYSPELNGYEVLGVIEWGKSIKLAECNAPDQP